MNIQKMQTKEPDENR